MSQRGIQDSIIMDAQGAIDRGVQRIDRNIVFVSQLSQGRVTDATKCDLADLIRSEALVFESRCSATGIELQVVTPQVHEAVINQTAVWTVLVNLITNSMQAIEESRATGKISVSLTTRSGKHCIEVRDDGPGVPAEVAGEIFKRQATQKTGGTGVGLYFTKTVVEACGGSVGFHSEAGRGARFWAIFPKEVP